MGRPPVPDKPQDPKLLKRNPEAHSSVKRLRRRMGRLWGVPLKDWKEYIRKGGRDGQG